MILTIKVNTEYTSHPVSGRGQIKAVATAKGFSRTSKTVGYDHAKDPDQNHLDAGFAVAQRLVEKAGLVQGRALTRVWQRTSNGSRCWTYSTEV